MSDSGGSGQRNGRWSHPSVQHLILPVAVGLILLVAGVVVGKVTTDDNGDKAVPAPSTSAGPSTTPQEPTPEPSQPSTPPPSTTSTAVVPEYGQPKRFQTVKISAPRISCGRTYVDLDKLGQAGAVRVNGTSKSTDELSYGNCSPEGLNVENGAQMGTASNTYPVTVGRCATDASTQATAGTIPPADLGSGQAFCLVTDESAVVWMHLGKRETVTGNPLLNLIFRATLWPRAA
ncbi:hypothetical protein [Kribbella sp. DT2]|uniref:hypothetical protein n=1 Tax=Kribbella sp. DT2 TaxID=3393427 RepID=UPI003CEBCAD7